MKKIEAFSTVAQDIFINEAGNILKQLPGGPATFIKPVFEDLGIDYVLNLADEVTVEILLTAQGEFGRITTSPKQRRIKPQRPDSVLLVSTLLDEWLPPLSQSVIFLDVQGYVRDGNNFGAMKPFVISPSLANQLVCVKAEESEAQFLEEDFLAAQKMKQLAITKGSRGLDLYVGGKVFEIPTRDITGLPDTVGAGDTWFSAYVGYQIQGYSCLDAAKMAAQYVCNFLEQKRSTNEK